MLRTVTKNSTIIILYRTNPNYCRAASTAPPEARFEGGEEKMKCSDVTWALSRLTRMIVSLKR